MSRLIVIVISFMLPVLLPAMEEGSGKHITKWLRLDNGLSNNYIVSIDIDRYGAIWIGTEEGMNRFDGVAVNKFMKHSGSIPGNALNRVMADMNHDRIWVATQRAGLSYYDYSTGESVCFRQDSTDLSLPSDEITSVVQDSDGNIWFSTYTEGIGKYDISNGTLQFFNAGNVKGMPDRTIRSIVIGHDRRIYTAYYGNGLAVIDPEDMSAVHYRNDPKNPNSLPSNEIGSIYKDKDNNIWIGTRKGLALYRSVTNDFKVFNKANSGLPDGLVFSILRTSDNRLLASPDFNGVWEMSLEPSSEALKFTPIPETADIKDIGFHAMCEDRFGNLWLGSYGNGLMFISHRQYIFSLTTFPEISKKNVTSLACFNDGKMVAGTEGGGLDLLDTGMKSSAKACGTLPDKTTLATAIDRDGRCWSGSFNGKTAVTDTSLNILATIEIREVRDFHEHGDTMWVVSGLTGLYAVDMNTYSILKRFPPPEYFPDNYLKSVCVDNSGRLWAGTFRSGLFIFSKDMKKIAGFNTGNGLPSNTVNALLADPEGGMWAATDEGLVHFAFANEDIIPDRIYSSEDGMSSESVKAVIVDNNNTIWFSTSLSVCHIDPESGKVTEHSISNGITTGNFSANAAAVRYDGMLSFGSTEGVISFSPQDITDRGIDLSTHFSEIQIFDTNDPITGKNTGILLAGKSNVTLRSFQNNFKISFAADDFSLNDDIEYSYKVEGKDKNWYLSKNSNTISFRQLAPGNYTLKVRARFNNSRWSEKEAKIHIRILTPFYATKAALAVYILLVLAIAYTIISLYISKVTKEHEAGLDKERIARIREINEERLRFYTNITHELKTPLTLIIGPVEDLKNETSLPEAIHSKISTVHKNAIQLLDLINKLLNFRKAETNNIAFRPSYGDISRFIHDIGVIFSESNSNRNIEIRLDIEKNIMGYFDHDIITTILNNLLSNALKYTESGSVTLCLKTVSNASTGLPNAVISVSDTGIGIGHDYLEKIFDRYYQVQDNHQAQGTGIGLSLVKNLVRLHNGTISVDSEKGKGSTFTVVVPIADIPEETKDEEVEECEREDNSRMSVVVVEDNEDIREYIRLSLADSYDVHEAKNGAEGLALVSRYTPDIIVCDIMMPVMDGLTLCDRIKHDIRFSHIPFILLTAKDTIEDRSSGYKAGADSYITKPFTSEMLKSRILNLLESRRKLTACFSMSATYDKAIENFRNCASEIDNEFLKRVTQYIEDNLSSEELNINTLADKMNMSLSSFYRKMKSIVGISASEYIRKVKMNKAAEMLSSGKFNISETAWNIGMSSMTHFRQCFKEEYGLSPSEFRKKCQSDKEGQERSCKNIK